MLLITLWCTTLVRVLLSLDLEIEVLNLNLVLYLLNEAWMVNKYNWICHTYIYVLKKMNLKNNMISNSIELLINKFHFITAI